MPSHSGAVSNPSIAHALPRITKYCAWPILAGLAVVCGGSLVGADASATHGHVYLSLDNDLFLSKDNNYTNGVSLGWSSSLAPAWEKHPGFGWAGTLVSAIPYLERPDTHKAVSLDFMQAMYTPVELELDPPDPNDRPYCGVAMATLGLHQLNDHTLTSLDLSLGVVGPASGAEATQKWLHEKIDAAHPEGWDEQIGNGLLVNVALDQRWRYLTVGEPYDSFGVDGAVGGTAMLGSFRTSLIVNTGLRIGYRMTSAHGTMIARPGSEGRLIPPEVTSFWGCHAGIMVAGEAVAYDVTLDGRLFSDEDPSVDKEPLIARYAIVFGGHVSRLQIYMLLTFSTKTFEGESESPSFGRMIGVWTF